MAGRRRKWSYIGAGSCSDFLDDYLLFRLCDDVACLMRCPWESTSSKQRVRTRSGIPWVQEGKPGLQQQPSSQTQLLQERQPSNKARLFQAVIFQEDRLQTGRLISKLYSGINGKKGKNSSAFIATFTGLNTFIRAARSQQAYIRRGEF